jgi:hypothetical protein
MAVLTITTAASAATTAISVGGHQLSVQGSSTSHTVTLDGRPFVSDDSDMFVSLLGPYNGAGHTYVLVMEQSGGNACAAVYQAIDLSGSVARITPSFGSCDDEPHAHVSKSGQLVVRTRRAQPPRYEVDVVRDGHLTSTTANR